MPKINTSPTLSGEKGFVKSKSERRLPTSNPIFPGRFLKYRVHCLQIVVLMPFAIISPCVISLSLPHKLLLFGPISTCSLHAQISAPFPYSNPSRSHTYCQLQLDDILIIVLLKSSLFHGQFIL